MNMSLKTMAKAVLTECIKVDKVRNFTLTTKSYTY